MSVKSGWPAERPSIKAQYDSVCPECSDDILEGDTIHYSEYHDAYVCDQCEGV